MHRTLLVGLLILLSFLGIADSWYLYQSAVTDTALSCDIGTGLDGCNIVAASPYSHLLGLPLALYGVGFFTGLFALGLGLLFLPSRRLYGAFYALSAFGSIASIVFLMIQFAVIKAFCAYCFASALIIFTLLVVSSSLWKGRLR